MWGLCWTMVGMGLYSYVINVHSIINIGVTIVGAVANTKAPPVPVSSVTAVFNFALVGSCKNSPTPAATLIACFQFVKSGPVGSFPEFAFAVKTEGVQQYASMRGSR